MESIGIKGKMDCIERCVHSATGNVSYMSWNHWLERKLHGLILLETHCDIQLNVKLS